MSHYEILADVLTATCGNNYDSARIFAKLDDGHSELRYICVDKDKETIVEASTINGWNAHKALHAIRTQMTIPGQKPWSKCNFTLFPDGTFKFDVEYDD
jgi:hypothetical protein